MSEDVNVKRTERVNVFHFLLGSSKATFMPFFMVFARTLGLTGVGTGFIVALQVVVHSVTGLLTLLTRRSKRMKLILVLCLVLMVFNYGALLVIPLRNRILDCEFNHTTIAQPNSSPRLADHSNHSSPPPKSKIGFKEDLGLIMKHKMTSLVHHIHELTSKNQTQVTKPTLERMSKRLKHLQLVFDKMMVENKKVESLTTPVPVLNNKNTSQLNIYQRIQWLIHNLHHEVVENLGISNNIANSFTLEKLTKLVQELHVQIKNINSTKSIHRHRRSTKSTPDDVGMFSLTAVWNPNGFMMPGSDPKVIVMIVMCILMITGSAFLAPVERSSDSLWFTILERQNESNNFGSHHLWASIGFGTFGGVTGTIVHYISCDDTVTMNDFFYHLVIFVIMLILTLVVSFFYPYDETTAEISWLVSKDKDRNFRDAWKLALSSNHSRLLLVLTVIFGLIQAPLEMYVYWRAVDLGVNEIIIGGIIFLRNFFEPFFLMICIKLIQRITYNGLICSSLLLLAVRYLCYSFMTESWQFLMIELVHSFITTALWTCIYAYPDLIVDPIMDRKVQTIINSIFNLGYVVGLIVSGILYDSVSVYAHVCYALAVFSLAWCLLFGIVFRYLPEKQIFGYSSILTHEPPDGESPNEAEDSSSEEEIELYQVKEA